MRARTTTSVLLLLCAVAPVRAQTEAPPVFSREAYVQHCSLASQQDAPSVDWGVVAAKASCSFRRHRPGYPYADEIVTLPAVDSPERALWWKRLRQIRDVQEGCVFPCTRKEEVELYFGMLGLLGRDLGLKAAEMRRYEENYTEAHPVDVEGVPTPRVKVEGVKNTPSSGDLARRYLEWLSRTEAGKQKIAFVQGWARNLGDLLRSDPRDDDALLPSGTGADAGVGSGTGVNGPGTPGGALVVAGGQASGIVDVRAYAARLNAQEKERQRRSPGPRPSQSLAPPTPVGQTMSGGGPLTQGGRGPVRSRSLPGGGKGDAEQPRIYLILVGPSYGSRTVEHEAGGVIVKKDHELGDKLWKYAVQLQREYETKDRGFRHGVDRAVIAQFMGRESFLRAWNRDYHGALYKVDVLSHGAESGIGAGGVAEGRDSSPFVSIADLRTFQLKRLDPGGLVVLWGCLTGAASESYGRSFASELAEHLGSPVVATPGYDYYRSKWFGLSDEQDVGPDKLTGEWRMFDPPGYAQKQRIPDRLDSGYDAP